MAGVSTPELAAEVSNQGGLGSLGLGANTAQSARTDFKNPNTYRKIISG